MPVTLNWTDTNSNEDGHRVYRSTATIDPAALPTPLADLGADVATYTDGDVTEGETYYYRVSAYRGTSENVSEELIIEALPEADAYVASVGAVSYDPAETSSRVVQVPPEAGVGDLLILCCYVDFDFSSTEIATPTGWTQMLSSGANGLTRIFTKFAASEDLGGVVGVSITYPNGTHSVAQMLSVRGAAPSLGILDSATATQATGNPPWPIAALTVATANTLVIAFSGKEGVVPSDAENSMSSGWTLVSDSPPGDASRMALGWQKITEPGVADGEFSATSTDLNTDYVSLTFSIGRAP